MGRRGEPGAGLPLGRPMPLVAAVLQGGGCHRRGDLQQIHGALCRGGRNGHQAVYRLPAMPGLPCWADIPAAQRLTG